MRDTRDNIIVIGIGNNGRCDDGLGWAFAEVVEDSFPEVEVVYRYQLQIEDAEMISHYQRVIFVDSSLENFSEGYNWKKLLPSAMSGFTSHALEPAVILSLCENIYDYRPDAYQLGISGKQWELNTSLSKVGMFNLRSAINNILPVVKGLINSQLCNTNHALI